MEFLNHQQLRLQIRSWLEEDVGPGDITSLSTIPESAEGKGIIFAKSPGIFAGAPILRAIFAEVDRDLRIELKAGDGEELAKGTTIAEVHGRLRSILTAERTVLNCIQRLSGIATKTRRLVEEARKGNPRVRVVDTRKTTPGLRMLEKYAVAAGGGHNHRYGLYDAVMIKDNHIKAAGGIGLAVASARTFIPHTMKIEVETENLAQVREALEAGADIIMFDNMPAGLMREAVALVGERAVTEASGGVTMANIAEMAATGVQVISMGALTYSVEALDISLDLFEKKTSI